MRLALAVLMLGTLLGCKTPYQPLGWRGGYSEQYLGDDVYYLAIRLNRFSEKAVAEVYFHRRATEIIEENDCKEYDVLEYRAYRRRDRYRAYGKIVCLR